jgi:ppGpp synthetase/RelA/SpoT-type nucleotidyltranferase
MRTSISQRTQNFREELSLKVQGTQIDIQTRTFIEAVWCELETRLAEVKTWAEHGCCGN